MVSCAIGLGTKGPETMDRPMGPLIADEEPLDLGLIVSKPMAGALGPGPWLEGQGENKPSHKQATAQRGSGSKGAPATIKMDQDTNRLKFARPQSTAQII